MANNTKSKKVGKVVGSIALGTAIAAGAGVGGYAIGKNVKPEEKYLELIEDNYNNSLSKITKLTAYTAEEILDVSTNETEVTIVTKSLDNRDRETLYYLTIPTTVENVDTLEDFAKAAKEAKDEEKEKSYSDYIQQIYSIVKPAKKGEVTKGYYMAGTKVDLEAKNIDVYTTAYTYYVNKKDNSKAKILTDNYNDANGENGTFTESNAQLAYTVGNETANVSAVVGDLEIYLTYTLDNGATMDEVKTLISDYLTKRDATKIESISYSDNMHEKILAEISDKLNLNEVTEELSV